MNRSSSSSSSGPARGVATVAALLMLAAGALAAAVALPAFRDAEGFLNGGVALPLGAAAAFVVLGATRRQGWRAAGAWAALALAGQGAFLSLVDAGPAVGYQHLRVGGAAMEGLGAVATAVLGLQAVVLAWRAWGPVTAFLGRLGRGLGVAGTAFVAAGFVLTSATLSRDVGVYLAELALASLLQGLQLGTVVVAAAAAPPETGRRWADRLLGPAERDGWAPDPPPWGLAAWTVAVTALLSVVSYHRHPHVPDEVIYLIHARYFAQGLLELPLPPVLAGFDVDLMTYDPDRWFSPVPPGWPAMLAVGALLGAPWLVNPVLAGVAVLLTPRAVGLVYPDRRVGRLATLLMAVSPWFLFMGMNFMTHTFTLVAALCAAWAVGWVVRGGATGWMAAGGVALGVVALIRPLEGLVAAATLGFWSLVGGRAGVGRRLVRTGVLAATTAASVAAVFPYNVHFTGRATHFPIMDYTDRMYGPGTNAMGFGPERGLGWTGLDPFPGHGLIDVLVNANLNLYQVNVELLGWGVGSILLLALLMGGRRLRRPDVGMILAAGLVIGAHSFYWFSGGPDFGARYWYLILVPALALSARGLLELAERSPAGSRTWVAAVLLVAGALLVFMPWRAIDKYHHYRNMRPDVRRLAEDLDFGDALVLVRGDRHPDYASAVVYNPLRLDGEGTIYAWDRSAEVRAALLEAFPDRPVWVLDGPTVTGTGYRVVAGPVTDRSALPPPP